MDTTMTTAPSRPTRPRGSSAAPPSSSVLSWCWTVADVRGDLHNRRHDSLQLWTDWRRQLDLLYSDFRFSQHTPGPFARIEDSIHFHRRCTGALRKNGLVSCYLGDWNRYKIYHGTIRRFLKNARGEHLDR